MICIFLIVFHLAMPHDGPHAWPARQLFQKRFNGFHEVVKSQRQNPTAFMNMVRTNWNQHMKQDAHGDFDWKPVKY